MILHHPFTNPEDLLSGHPDWRSAYHNNCLAAHHLHFDDTLPRQSDIEDHDNESDAETIDDDDPNGEDYRADWMQEAARRPNQAVQSEVNNLGSRDMDLEYDWLANCPGQEVISHAGKWLSDQVKESPNDDIQDLPDADYAKLKGEQCQVFLQVMAYFKKIKTNDGWAKPPPLRINVDGTAGTGKSFLIWAISGALRLLYEDELDGKDPVVRLAPTGISAFGIRGWTINFGLAIPVKEGKEFNQLGQNALKRHQTRWKDVKLLILDEKSMVGRAQMGRCDRRLRQAYPENAEEILGGLPALFFGDFAQLPPIGDTPLYSTKNSGRRLALTQEGRRVFDSFEKSITLSRIFRQEGEDPDQVRFRDALLRLRIYSTTQEDYEFFSTRFWDNITVDERTQFANVLHLLPTRAAVLECNTFRLAQLGKPVIRCKAKHNCSAAAKASEEDADGLEAEILLAEGAKVMVT
jgi:hypothetical protein